MRRQFFSFFMPLLQRQLYRDFCLRASMALLHSSFASRPVARLKLLSLPATHCLSVLYLVLQLCSLRHWSLAFTQSRRSPPGSPLTSADRNTSGKRRHKPTHTLWDGAAANGRSTSSTRRFPAQSPRAAPHEARARPKARGLLTARSALEGARGKKSTPLTLRGDLWGNTKRNENPQGLTCLTKRAFIPPRIRFGETDTLPAPAFNGGVKHSARLSVRAVQRFPSQPPTAQPLSERRVRADWYQPPFCVSHFLKALHLFAYSTHTLKGEFTVSPLPSSFPPQPDAFAWEQSKLR